MAVEQSGSSRLEGRILSDPLGISATGMLFLSLAFLSPASSGFVND